MGAEDFGLFGAAASPSSCSVSAPSPPNAWPASSSSGEGSPSLHSALYYPDADPSIRTGVQAMTAAVVSLLHPAP